MQNDGIHVLVKLHSKLKLVLKVIQNCFGFALLRSVIKKNKNKLAPLEQNQNQSRLGYTRFPVPGAGHVYLYRVLIGSLCCLHLLWLAIVIALVPKRKK